MVSFTKTFANLSAGEMAPALAAREDLSFYDRGLKTARNILCLPAGGFTDRGGFVHVGKVRNVLEAVDIPPGSLTVPGGATVVIGTDPEGFDIIEITDPVVPGGGGNVTQVDFGAAVEIHCVDAIDFAVSGAAAADAWQIEYSSDAVSWARFGPTTFDAGATQSRRAALEPGQSVTARYWRINGLAAIAGRTFSAAELRFWRETATLSAVKCYGFAYDTSATYLMVHTDRNVEVYDARVRQASIAMPHASADVAVVTRAQSLDTLLTFHEDYQPWRVLRYAGADEWDARAVEFENIPLEQFDGETYTNGTNEVQEVYVGGMTAGTDRFNLTYGEDATEGILYAGGAVGSSGDTTAGRIEDALEALEDIGTGNVTVTCTNADTFEIEFVNDKGQQEHPVLGFGFLGPGTGDEVIQTNRTTQGKKGGEDIMSATRGWPACGTFVKGRLLLAGLKARPATCLFSVLSDYFDFDLELIGDGALSLAIDDDQVKRIRGLWPGKNIGIFTDDAEFWITDRVIAKGSPISFAKGSNRGVRHGLDILVADDRPIFVQADGLAVRAFVYSDAAQSFEAPNISRLAPHLVGSPGDWAVRRGGQTDGAELVFMANADGSAAVFGLMTDEEFIAWQKWDTDGSFVSFGTEGASDVHAVVRRTINGVTSNWLEAYDETCLYDAGVMETHGSPVSSVTGLEHLEGKTVELWLDGFPRGTATVSAGAVTLPVAASVIQLGLPFTVQGEVLPIRASQIGSTVGRKARIHSLTLSLQDCGHVAVSANGRPAREVRLRRTADAFKSVEDSLFTGEIEIAGLTGYTRAASFTITQLKRAPLGRVRAVTADVRMTQMGAGA